MISHDISPANKTPLKEEEKKKRKPYHKPQLEELGDLRTLTLGGSNPMFIDSGGGAGAEYVRM